MTGTRLRCRFCGDELPQGLGLDEAGFVTHHSEHRHALTQAQLALERGDLHAALLALLWVVRERTEGVQHIQAVIEVSR
ncbi:MAG: hypothetical protein QN190_14145 [Armatimonadota bacterium]|nr:hypothetical protein [Armatimonadota bacterium]